MNRRILAAAVAIGLPFAASAQFVSSVKVEPAQIKTGESAKITVGFDVAGGINCGLRMHYGDGTTQDFKINQKKDVPLVTERVFAKGGDFEIRAEGKTMGLLAKCGGNTQSTMLKVAAPAVAAAPAPAPAPKAAAKSAAGPQCPENWKLDSKSVSKKTGAYTCAAAAGTKPPAGKLECPGDLSYYENAKKGRMGCRP